MHFSTRASRVFDCLGAEKWSRYALCRPGVKAWKAAFKTRIFIRLF